MKAADFGPTNFCVPQNLTVPSLYLKSGFGPQKLNAGLPNVLSKPCCVCDGVTQLIIPPHRQNLEPIHAYRSFLDSTLL